LRLFRNKAGLWLSILLLVQGAAYYAIASRRELTPELTPLQFFSSSFGSWHMIQDAPVEKEILDVLRADDILSRVYRRRPDGMPAVLFIAYFKTQRTGATPHSPKNCLPGSGWEPVEAPARISIDVGRAAPITVSRYVVALGEQQSVVLYWYQGHNRIIASEFAAKFWLIADSIRYRRSDTALVKIVVPVVVVGDAGRASDAAVDFVRAAYPDIALQLPL
jgi:EpsI family protein